MPATQFNRTLQEPVKTELDKTPVLEEMRKATEQLKSGTVAGIDGIPLGIWNKGGPANNIKFHEFFACCWKHGKPLQHICESDCSNYRGITLFSIAGKISARVLLNSLIPINAEEHLPDSQCGFWASRGNTAMVFAL